MAQKTSPNENIAKVAELIKGIRYAMMTTIGADGSMHSRPMDTQEQEFQGKLWLFTDKDSVKVDELEADNRVNLAFAAPDDNRYLSLFGRARVVRDQAKIDELWNPALKAWFPEGKDDPSVVLVEVTAEIAQYWDSPSSKLVELVGFAKALVTGEEVKEVGDSGTVTF